MPGMPGHRRPIGIPPAVLRIGLGLGLAAAGVSLAGPMGTFYTAENSRQELFPGFTELTLDTLRVDSAVAARAKAVLKRPVDEKQIVFERLRTREGEAGYVYRGRERGKVEWMDFAVALGADGKVRRVLLTVYREPVGGEVGSRRFMDQFRGKDAGSTLAPGRDIDGISGATISSRSLAAGVRKAACLWAIKYGKT
jgi:hypothetical protein